MDLVILLALLEYIVYCWVGSGDGTRCMPRMHMDPSVNDPLSYV